MNHKVLFNGDGSMLFRFEGLGDMVPIAEFEKLTAERDSALAQNAELVAMVEALQNERESILQEAKIHATELDTQKSIVVELCGLFNLRVHDYHCVEKVRQHLRDRDAEVGRAGFIEGCVYAGDGFCSIPDAQAADQYAEKVRRGEV